MERKEMMKARAALIDAHRNSSTPAETVAALVGSLGYDNAREIVALCVLAKGEWDARISEKSRRWAFDLTGGTSGTLAARGFYYPDEIHPAHMEQIAAAMMAYQPEPEQPAAPQITETRTMDAEDLRALCIKKEWYTYGNNEEYEKLFQRLNRADGERAEMTPAKLYEIAEDIRRNSDWRWTAPAIMYELAGICRSFFEIE